jgi:Mn-dependent DtxR family transcriptional regulator
MHLQESGEMYLETIHVLSKKLGVVRSIDICEEMGYSKPSVSRAMSILKEGGYIVVEKGGHIVLTDAGREVAEKIYNRHTLLTKFLTSIGVDDETAAEDACRLEHHISDVTYEAIKKHMGI